MINLSVIRQLIPEDSHATLESALAFLQDISQPGIPDNEVSEVMDATHFNNMQRDIISALNVLYTEIDSVEVILKQASNRTDSGLAEMASKLDTLYKQAQEAKLSLDNREAPLVHVNTTRQLSVDDFSLYEQNDIATIEEYGLTTQLAGKMLQSSYSGIPVATVNINTYTDSSIPCRIGIPASVEPYPKPMSAILNENNTTFWSETILSETILQADKTNVSWLNGTEYVSGAAVQLVFDFESATRISQIELVPFAPMPINILAVHADDTLIWESSVDRFIENAGKITLFIDKETPVISRKYKLTIAQPHFRQIEYGISQQNEQDLKYWQSTARLMYPSDINSYDQEAFNESNLGLSSSIMYNNEASYSVSDSINEWTQWADNFPQELANNGIVLPKEQYGIIRSIGSKFGQINDLLSTLAKPAYNNVNKVLRYEYVYGFRQVNFLYSEYNKEGRFISDTLYMDGELRQVKAALITNPIDAEITKVHDGELVYSGHFEGLSNVLHVETVVHDYMKGMYCYLEDHKNTKFIVTAVNTIDKKLTLDKSQKTAFPDINIEGHGGTWYFYTEDLLKDAEKNITLKLSLRDTEIDNAIRIDDQEWTTIDTQTEKPLTVQNPYRIANLSTGDMFVVYTDSGDRKVSFCTASGIIHNIGKPANFTITDIFANEFDSLFLVGYTTDYKIEVYELLSAYATLISNTAVVWDKVSETDYAGATTPFKVWHSSVSSGISNYANGSTINIVLTYKRGDEYGIDKLSRLTADAKGTTLTTTTIPFSSDSDYFPFKITSAVGVIQNDMEYFYLTKAPIDPNVQSEIDSEYINGVYRCKALEGMETKPIFYAASSSTYQAFDFVRVAGISDSGSDNSVFGVTSSGQVIEAKILSLDEYSLIDNYPTTVASWDSDSYPIGLVTVSNQSENNLYVVDRSNHCIKVFILENENVITYKGWIGYGESTLGESSVGFHTDIEDSVPMPSDIAGGFKFPEYITIDDDKNLLVSDTGNNRIQKLDQNGTPIYWLGADELGTASVHNKNDFQPTEVTTVSYNLESGVNTGCDPTEANLKVGWDHTTMQPGKWYTVVDNTNANWGDFGSRVRSVGNGYVYSEIVCTNPLEDWSNQIRRNMFVVQKLSRNIDLKKVLTLEFDLNVQTNVVGAYNVHLGNGWDGNSFYFQDELSRPITSQITVNQAEGVFNSIIVDINAENATFEEFSYIGIELTVLTQHHDNRARLYYDANADIPFATCATAIGCVVGPITSPTLEDLIERKPISSNIVNGFSSPKGVSVTRIRKITTTVPVATYYFEILSVADYDNNRLQNIAITTDYPTGTADLISDEMTIENTMVKTSVDLIKPTSVAAEKYASGSIPSVYTTLTSSHIVTKIPLAGSVSIPNTTLATNRYPLVLMAGVAYPGTTGTALSVEVVQGNSSAYPSVSYLSDKVTITLGTNQANNTTDEIESVINNTVSTRLLAEQVGAGDGIVVVTPEKHLVLLSEVIGLNTDLSTINAGIPSINTSYPYGQAEIDGAFVSPYALYINNGKLSILDKTGRMQTYTIGTGPTDTLDATKTFGSAGTGDNQAQSALGMHIDQTSNLMYISDTGNKRVKVYTTVDSYIWDTIQVAEGDDVAVSGVEYIYNKLGQNLTFYICQSDGHVNSYSFFEDQWRRTSCEFIAGGIASMSSSTLFSGNKDLYAIGNSGTIYKSLASGQWQWLRAAAPQTVIIPNRISETFTSTNNLGKVTLKEWPYIDFSSIYNYYNNNNSVSVYNPNNKLIPVQSPFEVEITLKDGTKAISDSSGIPFQTVGRKRFHTITSSINTLERSSILSSVSPYIMSPVTIVDEEALGNYSSQLSDSGINFKRGQTSLTFSRIVGRRVFKSKYKDWLSDPSFKIGLLMEDKDGDEKLYYSGSSTHKVHNLPNPDIIPKEGMIIFREDLPQYFELSEPGQSGKRLVEKFDDELKIVVFDFFAPDYVVPVRNNDGTLKRDANNEYEYEILQTRSVPYTTNSTDYLRGLSPDVSKTPYNANVPINDPAYNPVFMYTHNGRDIVFNSVLTEKDVDSIVVNYNSLELRPRLIIDLNRCDYPVSKTPIIESCNLLVGRIIP